MEIVIAAFIGVWLSFFAVWSYLRLKKEYREILKADKDSSEKKNNESGAEK